MVVLFTVPCIVGIFQEYQERLQNAEKGDDGQRVLVDFHQSLWSKGKGLKRTAESGE